MKIHYLEPEVEITKVTIENNILSNGENLNIRSYEDEYDDNPWA